MYDVLRFVVGICTSNISFDIKFTLIIFIGILDIGIGILDLYYVYLVSVYKVGKILIDLDISLTLNFRKIKN